jgi:hypothetical protein
VGIFLPDGSVQYRSDVGVESNTDGVKGESSDSFKRACVNWGIGGFLYDLGIEYLRANEVKTNTNYPFCVDDRGDRIYDVTKYINDKKKGSTPLPAPLPSNQAPSASVKAATTTSEEKEDRASKAIKKLKSLSKLNEVATLIKSQKDFRATPEGVKFVSGASVEDIVKINDIDLVLSFYKFVNNNK